MSLPHLATPILQRKCACGAHTPAGAECDACKKTATLQRKGGGADHSDEVPASVYEVLRSRGESLNAGDRTFFESRYGHDFGRVRVHSDAAAAASASAVNASAYTVGHHVVFGSNRFQPGTSSGRQLLAHELAHVVQQRGASIPGSGLRIGSSSSSLESSADHAAARVLSGQGAGPAISSGPMVAREEAESDVALAAGAGAAAGAASVAAGVAGAGAAAKKCPKTHTFPTDVYKGLSEAWKKSGHGKATVTEHGGRVVTDKDGKRAIRTGSGGGGSISLPAEEAGDTTLGTFHSHPYSKSEGSHYGVPFSGGDITNFVAGDQGSFKYIAAGSCNFALDTLDSTARDGCKSVDINKRWDDASAAAKGSLAKRSTIATKAAIKDCGLCFYRACRPDSKSPIPKVGKLVT